MSHKTHLLAAVIAAFFIASCGASDSEAPNSAEYAETKMMDSTSSAGNSGYEQALRDQSSVYNEGDANKIQSELELKSSQDSIRMVLNTTAAGLNVLDSTHMFIRTADVRCRVAEVANSTYKVEDVVKNLGGYISDTKLASNQTWQQQVPISEDSMKQITKFNVVNTITIRVPAKHLDSLLRALVPLVQYMDYRNVNVNDITLEQLAKQMEQRRLAQYNALIQSKVVDQTNKADKIMNAAESMLAKQAQSDNAYLESLRLNDRVLYATLNLQFYQPEKTSTTIVFREKPLEPYYAGIGARLSQSLYAGWKGFSYFLAGLALLWPLWVIGAGVWIIVRWQLKKRAKAI